MINCCFHLITIRAAYCGLSMNFKGIEPTLGLAATPYQSTTVCFNMSPLQNVCELFGTYVKNKWEYSTSLRLVGGSVKFQPKVVCKLNPETALNIALSLSDSKVMLCTGLDYDLDIASRISFGIKGGLTFDDYGLVWRGGIKFSYSYHNFRLSLPLMLGSCNVGYNRASLLFTLSLMVLGAFGFGYFVYRDSHRKR